MALESAHVEDARGRPRRGEHELRRGFDVLCEPRRAVRALDPVAGLLADALVGQGKVDEADDMTVVARSSPTRTTSTHR